MWIDIIVVILCLLALFKGLSNGLVLAVFSFLSYLIGLAAALKFSAVVAAYLGHHWSVNGRWLPFLAFSLIFILVVFLVRLGARAIESVIQVATLGWLNKGCGILLYAFLYLFIFSIVLFYGEQLHVFRKETAAASVTYPYLYKIAPLVMEWLAGIIPLFKNLFADLKQYFGRIPDGR